MKSVPRPFAPILLASIALCAGLATRADAAPKVIELAPRAAELPGAEASWNLDALGASAGAHPLMPRVATGGLTVFQATIPGAGLVRMVLLTNCTFDCSLTSFDPILYTDQSLGRTYVSQLLPTTFSLMAYTDDDGATWHPSQGAGIASGVDHQTVGGGPPARGPTGSITCSN